MIEQNMWRLIDISSKKNSMKEYCATNISNQKVTVKKILGQRIKSRILDLVPLYIALKVAHQILKAEMPHASNATKLEKSILEALENGEKKLGELKI